jgi:hypothetical protein
MQKDSPETWVHRVLGDFNFEKQTGFWAWYYRLTCPPPLKEGATFEQREMMLRCKRASALIFFLLIVMVLVALIPLFGGNKIIWVVVIEEFVVLPLCWIPNRYGKITLVGLLLIISMNGGMYTTLLTSAYTHKAGLTLVDQQIFLILFYGGVVASILLSFWVSLAVNLLNVALTAYLLVFAPHASLPGSDFFTLFRVGQEAILIPGILWIVMTQFQQAVARANQGEEVARLTRQLALEQTARAQQGDALERSVADIGKILTALANGEREARIPPMGQSVLYPIAGPINHLLDRHKRLQHDYQEARLRAWLLHELIESRPEVKAWVTLRMHEAREQQARASGQPHVLSSGNDTYFVL